LLVLSALAFPTFLACALAVDFHIDEHGAVTLGALLGVVMVATMFRVYRHRIKDSAAMALTMLSAGIVSTVATARWLWKLMEAMGESALIFGGIFLNTGVIGALIAGWVWLIRKLTLQMAAEKALTVAPTPASQSENGPLTWRQALQRIPPEERSGVEQQITAPALKPHEPMWLKAVRALGGWVAAWTVMPRLFFVLGIFWQDDGGTAVMITGCFALAGSI
jgi:hypothetical protein